MEGLPERSWESLRGSTVMWGGMRTVRRGRRRNLSCLATGDSGRKSRQGWLQGHSGISQRGKSRSIPLLCHAVCDVEETLQSCRCCTGAATGVQCGLPPEPVLTHGLPALLQPGSLSAATASPLSRAAAARQVIWLKISLS